MKILKLLLAGATLLAPAALLANCSKATAKETVFPASIALPLLAGTHREADCKVDHIFETSERNIECVTIDFPAGMVDADEKDSHAVNLTRQYAEAISAEGWLAEPIGDYIVNFEKPVTDECSIALQLMTWVVDEAKPVEERYFPSARFTLIERHVHVCGEYREISP
ncbi:MAG: hypothetical protein V3U82_03280 [Robiginitomaculum sp.]